MPPWPKTNDFPLPGRRSKNRDALTPILEEKLKDRTADEWIDTLNAAGIPCGPILSIDQVFDNEQVRHLGLAHAIEHPALGSIQILGLPVTLSRTPASIRTPTAEKGQHTDENFERAGGG